MQKVALAGMIVGFAAGLWPGVDHYVRVVGWVGFLICAVPLVVSGIRRRNASRVEGSAMLANNPPDPPESFD